MQSAVSKLSPFQL